MRATASVWPRYGPSRGAAARGEAGLMGIALAPDFATSRALYTVATVEQDGDLVNRVLRMSDENGKAGPATVILDGIPGAVFHAGGAIAWEVGSHDRQVQSTPAPVFIDPRHA